MTSHELFINVHVFPSVYLLSLSRHRSVCSPTFTFVPTHLRSHRTNNSSKSFVLQLDQQPARTNSQALNNNIDQGQQSTPLPKAWPVAQAIIASDVFKNVRPCKMNAPGVILTGYRDSNSPNATDSPPTDDLPHREWEDIATLGTQDIVAHHLGLQSRCAMARHILDKALNEFELCTRRFLAKHKLTSSEEIAVYLRHMNEAAASANAIFQPQKLYRNNLTTYSMLVTDLIKTLPEDSVPKRVATKRLEEGMARVTKLDVYCMFLVGRGLQGEMSAGAVLLDYMTIVRQRCLDWMLAELNFFDLAEACLDKKLTGPGTEPGSGSTGATSAFRSDDS
jgi:hypothetical protein